jgi:predicted O-linked N-acetylglucosamine transferase (SPINDLY family)
MQERKDWIKAREIVLSGDIEGALAIYENKIQESLDTRLDYWEIGLLHLLAGDEATASELWMNATFETLDDSGCTEADICSLFEAEEIRQEELQNLDLSLTICHYIHELFPFKANNNLKIISLSARCNRLEEDLIENLDIIPQLLELHNQSRQIEVNPEILLETLSSYIAAAPSEAQLLEFLDVAILVYPGYSDWLLVVLPAALQIAHSAKRPKVAAKIAEVYLKHDPDNIEFLGHLSLFYQSSKQYELGIQTAKKRYELTIDNNIPEAIFSSHLILRAYMNPGGRWSDTSRAFENHKRVLALLTEEHTRNSRILKLLTSAFFLPYLRDDIVSNRSAQNRLGELCQKQIESSQAERVSLYKQNCSDLKTLARKKIRIGYISHCLTSHSVGWIVRWLIQYHDRSAFELYGYFLNYRGNNALEEWYISQMDVSYKTTLEHPDKVLKVADQISNDEIQILIDLDSITLDVIGEILAMKPAPIQITWLGWDASGLPAIDYFIADPYVLPENAEELYREKIYRLPESYVGVDGFEIGTPTLRRDDLNIPNDAVVYMTAQSSYKYNLETSKLYVAILEQVDNSYLIIKEFDEEASLRAFFVKLVDEHGIDSSRLIFIPGALSEMEHRANLGIADIILDTFPYNGATTTMETLWVGVPIVTKVGQQFAARNSYTMMINAGITEGIAWSDEEYIDWGVRLGNDKVLRHEVARKIKDSKHSAPLWNGKQFAKEMEKAYQQMWKSFIGK